MLICNALLLNEYIELHFNMLSKNDIEVGWSFTDALSNRIEFG